LDRLLPRRPGNGFRWIEDYYLGVETEDDAWLVQDFRGKVDPRYLRWALGQVVNWKNDWLPLRYFQLHGDRDRIFPVSRSGATDIVPGAGHFMVFNRPAVVNEILIRTFNSL